MTEDITPTPTPVEPNPTPSPEPAPVAEPTPQPSFIETLGEGYQGNEAFEGIEDAKSLADKYLEQGKSLTELQGKIPQAPESPDKYTDVAVPEGVILDTEASTGFKAKAHELGLSDDQYKAVVGYHMETLGKYNEMAKKQNAETMTALKKEMGDEKFKDGMATANKLLAAIPELKAVFGEADPSGEYAVIRNNPNLFKAFVSLGQKIQVDRLPNTPSQGGGKRPTGIDGRPVLSYPSMKG